MKKHYIFDFDGTIIETKVLDPYRNSQEGRKYLIDNIAGLNTTEYSPAIKKIIEYLHKKRALTILTNSPENETRAILKKHAFPDNLPIIGSARKPQVTKIENLVKQLRRDGLEVILIGDTPKDILTAHALRIPSLGVLWSQESTTDKILKAEPSLYTTIPEEFEEWFRISAKEHIEYSPRKNPNDYVFAQEISGRPISKTEVMFNALSKYIKVSDWKSERKSLAEIGYAEDSKKILSFKRCKDVFGTELKKKCEVYFYGGKLHSGREYYFMLSEFKTRINERIKQLNLNGRTLIIGLPNSLPEYCYRTDVNYQFTKFCAKDLDDLVLPADRTIYRVYPVDATHATQSRNAKQQLNTIGIIKGFKTDIENIILFDDIKTTGNQIRAVAYILRSQGYRGNIIGLTLGETYRQTPQEAFSALPLRLFNDL